MTDHRATFLRLCLAATLLAAVLPCANGCTALALIAGKTTMDTVPPEYKPRKITTLVLVESYHDPTAIAIDAATIEQFVIDNLRRNNTCPMADRSPLEDMRASNPDEFRTKTIRELGEMVGAKQVIYVNLIDDNVDRAPGSEMWRGLGHALVRVIDVTDGRTLWPAESIKGYPVDATTPLINEDQSQALTEQNLRSTLERDLADRISRLFYGISQEESQESTANDILNK